jgi:hypothetical protein
MEELSYYEPDDTLVIKTTYDPSALIEQNKAERAINGKAKLSDTRLVKVASIDEDHLIALKNKGYNLLSSDKDEVRRALCYIQDSEQDWMVVDGKPFAMWRPKWR